MHVELNAIMLTGLGVSADIEKLRATAVTGESIRMNIESSLRFPRPGYVECVVTVESDSTTNAMKFKCSYTGEFTLTAENELADEDRVKISASCTAKIFPYVRELVADITRRVPLTAPITLNPSLGDELALMRQMSVKPNEAEGGAIQ